MRRSRPPLTSAHGFHLLESLFVIAILGVLSSIAAFQMTTARPAMRGDSAMRVVLAQMRTARELAITQRRYVAVRFNTPNQIELWREEVPGPSETMVGSTMVEGGVGFTLVTGVPDTPDAFGASSAVDFGVAATLKFTPDGTLVNENGQGINGTVFLAMPHTERSARAVTVLGSTGRIRGFRWDGRGWRLV